jgi:hypothetical protein
MMENYEIENITSYPYMILRLLYHSSYYTLVPIWPLFLRGTTGSLHNILEPTMELTLFNTPFTLYSVNQTISENLH